jgi:hypothetical protein
MPSAMLWWMRMTRGRSAFVVLDQVKAPQGLARIQGLHGQLAGQLLQLLLAGAGGQRTTSQVCVHAEVGIILPERSGDLLHGALAEAAVARDQARFDGIAQPVEIHAVVEHHDPDDHHQVGRAVHAQPGGVDGGHSFASCHYVLPQR